MKTSLMPEMEEYIAKAMNVPRIMEETLGMLDKANDEKQQIVRS